MHINRISITNVFNIDNNKCFLSRKWCEVLSYFLNFMLYIYSGADFLCLIKYKLFSVIIHKHSFISHFCNVDQCLTLERMFNTHISDPASCLCSRTQSLAFTAATVAVRPAAPSAPSASASPSSAPSVTWPYAARLTSAWAAATEDTPVTWWTGFALKRSVPPAAGATACCKALSEH